MTTTIQNLQTNGNEFNPSTYNENDNLDALIVSSNNEIASIRVTANDIDINIISDIQQVSNEFKDFIEEFELEYDVRVYIVNGFQEYKYPFFEDFEIKKDNRIIVKWCLNNMRRDDRLQLVTKNNLETNEVKIIITRGDDGIIVDHLDESEEVIKTEVYYFDDFDDDSLLCFPTSCGVTSNFRPNITVSNSLTKQVNLIWYRDTFSCINDALDYLKVVYKNGLYDKDIGIANNGTWLPLDELKQVS